MAGTTDQEEQVKQNQASIEDLYASTSKINPAVKNRFDNFKSPFDYAAMAKKLNEIYNMDVGRINATAASDTRAATTGASRRMANAGITKGSLFNEAVSGAGENIASSKFNTLADLSRKRSSDDISLMDMENKNAFNIAGKATEVDIQNVFSQLKKRGLLSSILGLSTQNAGMYNDSTWLDDTLAIANTAAQFLPTSKGGAQGAA